VVRQRNDVILDLKGRLCEFEMIWSSIVGATVSGAMAYQKTNMKTWA